VIEFNKALPRCRRQIEAVVTATVLFALAGCAPPNDPAASQRDATLTIGYGENAEVGVQQAVRNIALEGLVRIDRDGRPRSWLAEEWVVSPDGMTLGLTLRPGATFHNGQPATAEAIRDIVARDLPEYVGSAFDDVQQIRARTPYELEFLLKRRSSFLLEGLDLPITLQRGETPVGSGPFSITRRTPSEVEMRASSSYYGGTPFIDRIVFNAYDSVRSAWADLLRGRVDMVYEVGIDALDSLSLSTQTKVFTLQRPYAFLVFLNVRSPKLRDKARRRTLNEAIDRDALVTQALNSHAAPADGPVWPHHWAYGQDLPRFRFQPRAVHSGKDAVQLSCLLMTDRAHERVGLEMQRQLRAVGVELALEEMPSDRLFARLQAGDFEMLLVDARMGPSILQQYLFWQSKGPNNWGHFSSREVDAAFDRIRTAADDLAYKAGVEALQHALVDDPPAIFLAWGERLRAVSTRFEVHAEPGRDILSTLRLWRPIANGE
jgi:peptide/nickel transport system substrate-binding protein